MSKQVLLRRGTFANHSTFTGGMGEATFLTDSLTLRLHDGSTVGGIELARNGFLSKSVAGSSNVTLTSAEGGRPFIEFTGILTGNIQVIFPIALNFGKLYLLKNSTTGSFTLTVIGTSGTGIVLPQNGVGLFSHDGTNMVASSGIGALGYFSDGTAAAPSISFNSDTNTGFYRSGADAIDVTNGGTATAQFSAARNLLIGTTSETGLSGAGGLRVASTTEATTGGAGSIITLGGIYATKAIISGSATDSTTTASGGAVFAGGVGIGKTLTTSARILTTSIKTTTYTVLTTDHVIIGNHASTAFTVTLPSLVSATTGRTYVFKNKGAAIMTIDGSGSETIDGNLTLDLAIYESATLVNDGTQWLVI